MKYDYLIVGSGLFGATFAYKAHQAGRRCLVIERRSHLGGNIFCEEKEGIHVHKYGAHIFHTSNKEVWELVNSIVPFNRYTNCPVAHYKGRIFNLPFNMNTFYQMWGVTTPAEAQARMEQQRMETGIEEPHNLEEQALMLVGRDIYETLIKGYTEKQWGRPCKELPAFIIRRLPVRMVFDNNYFNDTYQGIPIGGYNRLTDGLLDGVETRTGVDFLQDREYWVRQADKVLYTGPIDAYFNYRFGPLGYRSVRFETETLSVANFQGNAVVNYTDREIPYTRIIEHKHFECFGTEVERNPHTVISREYSQEWKPGIEPYYPINNEENTRIYDQYRMLAEQEENVLFGGRLAAYKYYDMHQVMEQAIALAYKELCIKND